MDILNIIIGAWAARQVTYVTCLWRRWSNGRAVEWTVAEGLENELWRRWSDVSVVEWGGAFTYITAHSTILSLLHLRHRSFYNPSAASSTPQLILPTTLPPLHLRHRSFYNPSVASPTSQALHVLRLASRLCIGEWKNSLWWTSLLQQVTKFRSTVGTVLYSC